MSEWVTLRNTLGLTLRPIDAWPGRHRTRVTGPFTAPLRETLATLRRELRALGARNVVLQVAFRERDLRLDGLPRAGAVAEHPGVILSFDSKHGPLRLWFDGFTRWDRNLRAIALHLEHLRLATLYGVGEDGQQYRGWSELPPGQEVIETSAAAYVAAAAGAAAAGFPPADLLRDPAAFRRAYQAAARRLHPDQGGSHEEFVRLQKAAAVLRRLHGG